MHCQIRINSPSAAMQRVGQPINAPMPSTSYSCAPRACRARILRVRAAADAGGVNPFKKRDDKKEDAAKKALQEMFQGKKDILAAYDAQPDTGGRGGAGGKGGFGGGGGGGFGGFSGGFSDFGDNARKFFKSLGSTVGALLMFVAVIAVFSLWQPLMGLIVYVVRTALRLDARGAQRVRQQKMQQVAEDAATGNAPTNVGGNERNVMAKYGAGGEEEGVGEAAAAQAAAADLDEDL